ncbi:MAG: hypothetical protein ACTHKG_08545 [Nocardioides sp.]
MSTEAFTAALVAELGKKTGVCWLTYTAWTRTGEVTATHAVWHAWVETDGVGALYVVSGGEEQPLPGIEQVDRVEVTMRSKENGGRLLTWVAQASEVTPADEVWEPATTALVAGRLNLDDLSTAADEWAQHSRVTRLVPTGEVLEQPGALSDDAHRAVPRATPATTRGPLPRILHRRVKRRPTLS